MAADPAAPPVALPQRLAERTRRVGSGASAAGDFVLYWMRAALRAHDNPALDVAALAAAELDRPLFVYQGLTDRYPFASDRHHTFILEGARQVERELAERGVGSAFHLVCSGRGRPVLKELAGRAALVVTEDVPVAPLANWTRALARAIDAPLLAVDASCVVPMALSRSAPERAFRFRRATEEARRERVAEPWPEVEIPGPAAVPADLPFEPVDLAAATIPELVASCSIDHAVPPVPSTPGGGRAGYVRWEAFRDHRLARYARDRNDPLADGVSRLSPYLHYGMVSPFRIAREAAERGGDGAEKFLDEFLVWRELAWHFCFHRADHATVAALPDWARRTLAEHEEDPRPAIPSWETLARARTGDRLWDAAQRSLLIHGELHNNVRMTWGKALLSWTPDAGRALALLEDLNHRYALDGRDPASYGGILWCLGLFDRPFEPERPILGTVRPRPTSEHARRLDVAAYERRTARPAVAHPPSVLVVGAGIAGAACARALADQGLAVTVVDKGRGAGGRASTRRVDAAEDLPELAFDHGAQYFTVRDDRTRPYLASWLHDGVVAPWRGRIATVEEGRLGAPRGEAERWVGIPGMSELARHLGRDLGVERGVRVAAFERRDDAWWARDGGGRERGPFDRLLLALPAPQAVGLLAGVDGTAEIRRRLEKVEMAPCQAVMAAFGRRLDLPFDGAFVAGSPLAWVARDGSKPERAATREGEPDTWVLHATPEWSRRHLDDDPDEVAATLLDALAVAGGRELPDPLHRASHRWRWASITTPLGADCLYDPALGLGLAGDWCVGGRIEGAFLSGLALAGRLLGREAEASPGPERQTELF